MVSRSVTSKFFITAIVILWACSPARDRFLENVLLDFKTNGFIHNRLFQLNCQAEAVKPRAGIGDIRSNNRRVALETCKERAAYLFLVFAVNNGEVRFEPEKIRNFPEQLWPTINADLNVQREIRKQRKTLEELFGPLLQKAYVAREAYSPSGKCDLTMRIYHPDLIDEILGQEIPDTININRWKVKWLKEPDPDSLSQ